MSQFIFIHSMTYIPQKIINECSQFLNETQCFPLIKMLPSSYPSATKVKVRQRKVRDEAGAILTNTYTEYRNLYSRAVFAENKLQKIDGLEPYFIFAPDGYKYLYSKEVSNLSTDFKDTISSVFETFAPTDASKLMSDLIKYTYTDKNIQSVLCSGCEIILYNVQYFYAIKMDDTFDIQSLLCND